MPTDDAKFSLRELLYRSSDPALLLDTARRCCEFAWDSISAQEFSRYYRAVRRNTMCSNARLRNLYRSTRRVIMEGIAGDFVECGCARGGSAAMVALTQKSLGVRRPLWLFDTFEGLPAPTNDDPDREIADVYTGTCIGELEQVQQFLASLQVGDNVNYVKGLFQDTMGKSGPESIALLHIDGDWYDSVKTCLDHLYDCVTPGGIIQFDDYGYWKGARKAIDEFLSSRNLQVPLIRIDYSGRYLVKPRQASSSGG
jgi:hypothetical protein